MISWDVKGFDKENQPEKLFKSNKYDNVSFLNICTMNPPTSFDNDKNISISFVPMDNVSAKYGKIEKQEIKKKNESKGYTKFIENDIIWAKITPCMQNGKCAIAKNLINGYGCGSTEFNVFRPHKNIMPEYIYIFLRSKRLRNMALYFCTGTAGQQRVSKRFFENLTIPYLNIKSNNKNEVSQERIVKEIVKYNNEMYAIDETILKNEIGMKKKFEEVVFN